MTDPMSNSKYIWSYGSKNVQMIDVDQLVYMVEKSKLIRRRQLVEAPTNMHRVWKKLFMIV